MKRENYFDKMVTTYFDQLWANPHYLNFMGKNLKNSFAMRQQWNKQVEKLWEIWQLPNQEMQQRTLHQVNTLVSESRFENEEVQERLDKMESELAEIKALLSQNLKQEEAKDVRKSGTPKAE